MNKVFILFCSIFLITACGQETLVLPYEVDSEYLVVSQNLEFLGNKLDMLAYELENEEGLPDEGSLEKISENEIRFVYDSNCRREENIEIERVILDSSTLIISVLEKGEAPACGTNYFSVHLVLDKAVTFKDYEIYTNELFYNLYYRSYPSYQVIYPTEN